jgi:hypothetical protein
MRHDLGCLLVGKSSSIAYGISAEGMDGWTERKHMDRSYTMNHDRLFYTIEFDGITRHIDIPPNSVQQTIVSPVDSVVEQSLSMPPSSHRTTTMTSTED